MKLIRRLLHGKEKAFLPELVRYSLWATAIKYFYVNGYPLKDLIK